MSSKQFESLVDDLGRVLEKHGSSFQVAYSALQSACVLGFPRPAIAAVWQITCALVRDACLAAGVPGGTWQDDDQALFDALDGVISNRRIRTAVTELRELFGQCRLPETESTILMPQAEEAVEDLLGLVGWLQARELLKSSERKALPSRSIVERMSIVRRIYHAIGYEATKEENVSDSTIFLLIRKQQSPSPECVLVFVSEDITELNRIVDAESIAALTANAHVTRTLIISDDPSSEMSTRLEIDSEIRTFAAFVADLLNYQGYVAEIRRRFRDPGTLLPEEPMTAEFLQFDEAAQKFCISEVIDLESAISTALRTRAGNSLVLADAGGGKTHLCERVIDRILASHDNCFPVYLHLGRWQENVSFEDFLLTELGHFKALSRKSLSQLFHLLVTEGYVVCVLDAFDECVPLSKMETVLMRFSDLTELFTARSRVLLTSRVSFFQSSPELRQLLHRDAVFSERASQLLTTVGIEPLSLPNFQVVRLKRLRVDLPIGSLELTPLEVQLLSQMASSKRNQVLDRDTIRVSRSLLIQAEFDKALGGPSEGTLWNAVIQFFGDAHQEGVTNFSLTQLQRISDGRLFPHHHVELEQCLLSDLLMLDPDNRVRFRHLVFQEYLFAKQIVESPNRVIDGVPVSSVVRNFVRELYARSKHVESPDHVLPAGVPFIAGSADKAKIKRLPRSVQMQIHPVTVAQYNAFLSRTRDEIETYQHPDQPRDVSHLPPVKRLKFADYYTNPQYADHPAVCVNWWSAYAFAKSHGGRLPSADEWEFAARGRDGRLYPWGDQVVLGRANSADYWAKKLLVTWEEWKQHFDASGNRGGLCLPVDQFQENVSPFGVLGMAGNVWEWTGTTNPARSRAGIMGASFDNPFGALQSSVRCFNETRECSNAIGFRWCKEVLSSS